jgi:23S rRNA (guanosine2251-2'-O)-methyltransferase
LAVDGLTDPQNLGAIVRSAEALGAHGMVLPQRRNAGLTGSVAKVAAGALEHLPIARVVNLNRSLDTLKQEGYRVIGLAGEGNVSLEEADLEGPLVIVTGSEGDGLSLLTRRNCDQLVRIPLRGSTPSLNASVATALLLYEVARRSWMKGLSGSAPAPRLVRPALPTPAPQETARAEAEAEKPGLVDEMDPGLIADLDRDQLEPEVGTATSGQPAELEGDAATLPAAAFAPATASTADSGSAFAQADGAAVMATALEPGPEAEPVTAPTPGHATLAGEPLELSHDPASGEPQSPVDPALFDTDVRL